jgi:hypothetical protein
MFPYLGFLNDHQESLSPLINSYFHIFQLFFIYSLLKSALNENMKKENFRLYNHLQDMAIAFNLFLKPGN